MNAATNPYRIGREGVFDLPAIPEGTCNPITFDEMEAFLWNLRQGWMEESLVTDFIRAFLLSPQEQEALCKANLCVHDLLNGRYADAFGPAAQAMFSRWNEMLGVREFGC